MRGVLISLCLVLFAASTASAGMREGIDAFKNKRYDTALHELTPEAGRGDPKARYFLGLMFLKGLGVPQRPAFAMGLLQSAANAGHDKAKKLVRRLRQSGKHPKRLPPGMNVEQGLAQLGSRLAPNKGFRQQPPPVRFGRPPPLPPVRQDYAAATPQQPIVRAATPAPPKDLVLAVQKRLVELGFDPGPTDGISGEKTRTALRAFERMEGIAPTGVPSEDMLTRLNKTAAEAPRIEVQTASATPKATEPEMKPSDDIIFGSYRALVIGNNSYAHLPKLRTAKNDAEAIASVLEDQYDFKVTRLFDANRYDLVTALNALRGATTDADNVLIYYAGHGILDEEADEGYWLPVDAEAENPANWVSNATIIASLKAMPAKHVMVIADSCFSGKLTRGIKTKPSTPEYLERIAIKRARTALTSGGLEPVADGGGAGHSVFAAAVISALTDNDGVLDGTSLFNAIRRPVMLNSDQTPEYADIRKAGHDGGDFLFMKKGP